MALEPILLKEDEATIFPYKYLVICLLTVKYLIDTYLNFRQYKRLKQKNPIPKELATSGIKEEDQEEIRKYNKAKMEFEFIEKGFEAIFEILCFYFNYYPFVSEISKKMYTYLPLFRNNPQNEYGLLTAFILIEIVKSNFFSMPFEAYKTFVLEEKFGFNKTTVKTFFLDIIKTSILLAIFLPILISILVFIIIKGGKYFYIISEIALFFIILIFMWVYPNFIQPLYNKFKELEEGELRDAIFNLAKRVDYPLKKIYEIDQSQRSAHSNAYLFGFGRNKRIVLFDTLIEKLSPQEIQAVLGHELGHWKHWHSVMTMGFAFLHFFFMFYILQFFINENAIFISFGFKEKSVFIGLFLFFEIYSPLTFIVEIIQNYMLRRNEYQADIFSAELGYGEELKAGLTKLSEQNKSNLDPDPLYSFINYTHPTLVERIRAINKYLDGKKIK